MLDGESYLYTHSEIFEREIYRFESSSPSPLIIDGGANIGLSVIYFKTLFPQSRVIAFEPDPDIFRVLERNCATFAPDAELVAKGLWSRETALSFVQDASEAGHIAYNGTDPSKLITIPTVRLRDYLDQHVDMLKLDIEGAETEVLTDCADKLGNVERIFVEYHSFVGQPQSLHTVTGILAAAGFRVQVQSINVCPHPFIERPVYFGMDMQLNIYGYR